VIRGEFWDPVSAESANVPRVFVRRLQCSRVVRADQQHGIVPVLVALVPHVGRAQVETAGRDTEVAKVNHATGSNRAPRRSVFPEHAPRGADERAFNALSTQEKIEELKRREIELMRQANDGDLKAAQEYNKLVDKRMDLEEDARQKRMDLEEDARQNAHDKAMDNAQAEHDKRLEHIDDEKDQRMEAIDQALEHLTDGLAGIPTVEELMNSEREPSKEEKKARKKAQRERDSLIMDTFSRDERKAIRSSDFRERYEREGKPDESRAEYAARLKQETLQRQADEEKARIEAEAQRQKDAEKSKLEGVKSGEGTVGITGEVGAGTFEDSPVKKLKDGEKQAEDAEKKSDEQGDSMVEIKEAIVRIDETLQVLKTAVGSE